MVRMLWTRLSCRLLLLLRHHERRRLRRHGLLLVLLQLLLHHLLHLHLLLWYALIRHHCGHTRLRCHGERENLGLHRSLLLGLLQRRLLGRLLVVHLVLLMLVMLLLLLLGLMLLHLGRRLHLHRRGMHSWHISWHLGCHERLRHHHRVHSAHRAHHRHASTEGSARAVGRHHHRYHHHHLFALCRLVEHSLLQLRCSIFTGLFRLIQLMFETINLRLLSLVCVSKAFQVIDSTGDQVDPIRGAERQSRVFFGSFDLPQELRQIRKLLVDITSPLFFSTTFSFRPGLLFRSIFDFVVLLCIVVGVCTSATGDTSGCARRHGGCGFHRPSLMILRHRPQQFMDVIGAKVAS
mmetsp:Transcript_119619/g.178711  ORF Transcript_119619/g.178711 Transcript_119619/m.178711 type:complete len:350 (+) Transcript_119619:201-1250(+)